jgi:alkyldihydroxyacetonephosphate synthase
MKNLGLFLTKIRENYPEVDILEQKEERLIYAHGCYPKEYKWILQGDYKNLPSAVLIPNNTEELSVVMKLANELKIGIIPYGGGSGIVGGTIADNEEVMIDVKRFDKFEINPVNCTAIGGGGVTGADFENMLNEYGYTCGQYPQSFQSAVMGGMVATRAIGTFSTKYGKMDDMVTSMEVVLPTGEIVSTHKAPKRSTGPELNELFLGSEGVYGIVTSVEVKIYPVAEKRYFEAFTFPKTEQGLEAIRQFIQKGITPAVIRLYDDVESEHKLEKYGYEKGYALLIVGYEGMEEMVDLEIKVVGKTCTAYGGITKGTKAGDDWFAGRFTTKKMLDYDRMKGGTADAIEVAAPWDSIAAVWDNMRKELAPYTDVVDCHFSHVYHNGASVYVIFHASTGTDDFDGEERYQKCLEVAIETSLKYGGNISHHHGTGKAKCMYLKDEHGEAGYGVMKKIKDALDPSGILNKGVLGL